MHLLNPLGANGYKHFAALPLFNLLLEAKPLKQINFIQVPNI
jgi:hypothetical protein